jgi:hypothetical protein
MKAVLVAVLCEGTMMAANLLVSTVALVREKVGARFDSALGDGDRAAF